MLRRVVSSPSTTRRAARPPRVAPDDRRHLRQEKHRLLREEEQAVSPLSEPHAANPPANRQRKPRRGDGTLYQRGSVWWVKFYVHGRAHYESSRSPDKDVALRLLDTRRGQRASGAPVQPRLDLVTYQ